LEVLLSAAARLRFIGLLADRLRREIAAGDEPVDVLSTVALGAEMWQGVEVGAYLEEERAGWDC
jgi:hypothetical protein